MRRKHRSIWENRVAVCLGISLLAAGVTLGLAHSPFLRNMELGMLNALFRIRGERPGAARVLVVDVDETIVRQQGYPVPRKYHALVVRALGEAGARCMGFDIFFDRKSARPAQDSALAEYAGAVGGVRFPATFQPREQLPAGTAIDSAVAARIASFGYPSVGNGVFPSCAGKVGHPFAYLLSHLDRLCQVNADPDPDGFHRRVPLFVEYGGRLYPNLGLQLAMDYLGADPDDIRAVDGGLELAADGGAIRIPTDGHGNMLINFDGLGGAFETRSYFSVLRAYQRSDSVFSGFRDRIVVVGQSARAVGDIGPTPFDNSTALHYLHANVVSNIINRNFLARAPGWQRVALVVLMCLVTALLQARFKTKLALPLAALLVLVYGAAVLLAFTGGTWYELAVPVTGVMLTYAGCFTWIYFVVEKDERFVKDVFGKYVSDEVLQLMKDKDLAAAGERKELTILFSDVKSFSKISDEIPLEELVLQLKEYFDEMTRIIFKYDGYLDKFMGDGIMAFFNDPKERPDHALCGVRAAWEMQESMKALRRKWAAEGKTQFQIRVGMNTGTATVGNLGSSQKFTYTAFGSSVNVASRMESSGRPDGVQVTRAVYEATKEYVDYEDAGEISVKNIVKPVKVYFVKGMKDA